MRALLFFCSALTHVRHALGQIHQKTKQEKSTRGSERTRSQMQVELFLFCTCSFLGAPSPTNCTRLCINACPRAVLMRQTPRYKRGFCAHSSLHFSIKYYRNTYIFYSIFVLFVFLLFWLLFYAGFFQNQKSTHTINRVLLTAFAFLKPAFFSMRGLFKTK